VNEMTATPLYGQHHRSAILIPMPMPKPPAKTFREAEVVRLFTESGHPWLGILALAMMTGIVGTIVVVLLQIVKLLIERLV
jgi:hypothetical protein